MKKFKCLQGSYFFMLFLTLFFFPAFAQKEPIRYGKPSKEELEMKFCPFDPNAAAMVICDYGYFEAENLEFNRIVRFKIFKKEGFEWADWTNNWYPSSPDISGITFNIENGEVVEQRLKSSSIFTKNGENNSVQVNFTMPNIKEGSVFDVKIRYTGFPKDWYFQKGIPVAWSELVVRNSEYVRFRQNFFGYIPSHIVEQSRWVFKNVPAFVSEPYLDCKENYISKCEFELLDINYPDLKKTFTSSWQSINETLLADEEFGGAMGLGNYLNTIAKIISQNSSSELEKIKKAHEFIRNFKWNGEYGITVSKSNLGEVFKAEVGNVADLNLLLVMLLRKLDFKADPIVSSTRSNGRLSKYYPSLERLNYVLAYVKLTNGNNLTLDATNGLLPYTLLPSHCFNGFGEIVALEKSNFVDLIPTKSNQESAFYNLTLKDDLSFEGNLNFIRSDYAAYYFRKKYYSFNNKEEYLADFKKSRAGLTISNHKLKNLDSLYNPIKDEYEIKIEDECEDLNGEIYFKPLFYETINENPFKNEKRLYPVDYGISDKLTYNISIDLPASFSLIEKPKDVNIKTPDNSASFIYQITEAGSKIFITSKLTVSKQTYSVEEYPYLRDFFDRVVKKTNEPIVLKRN